MIGYITLGVSDMERSKAFYAELFADHGAKFVTDLGRIAFLGLGRGKPMLAICKPFDGEEAHPGNGTMAAFQTESKEEAEALYHRAISLGATCEGAPGQRMPDLFYGGYVRDPDGNKLCFYIFS